MTNRPDPSIAWWTLTLLCLGVGAYAWVLYGLLPEVPATAPEFQASFARHHPAVFYVHVMAAALALLIGPWQFLPALRARHPRLHRWLGRVYLGGGVLAGGVSGLLLAPNTFGGPVANFGFGLLALLWLASGWRAYRAIRQGRVDEHRRWMLRNFALACAAVTLRLYLPLSIVSGLPLAPAYAAIAWLCWVPNLLWAEWHIRRTAPAPVAARRGAFAG